MLLLKGPITLILCMCHKTQQAASYDLHVRCVGAECPDESVYGICSLHACTYTRCMPAARGHSDAVRPPESSYYQNNTSKSADNIHVEPGVCVCLQHATIHNRNDVPPPRHATIKL